MKYISILFTSILLLNNYVDKALSYEIGFISIHNNQSAIWLTGVDKLTSKKLIEEVDTEFSPVLSPDGKKIAFVSRDETQEKNIYIINTDGSGKKQLTIKGGEHPSWSPDSNKIVYSNKEGIWVILIDNLHKKQLIKSKYSSEVEANVEIDIAYHPKWATDEKKIAFKNILNKQVAISIIDPDGKIEGGFKEVMGLSLIGLRIVRE